MALRIIQLEERIVLDAAGAGAIADATDAADKYAAEVDASIKESGGKDSKTDDSKAGTKDVTDKAIETDGDILTDPGDDTGGKDVPADSPKVLVVSDTLDNADKLADAAGDDVLVLRYDSSSMTAGNLLNSIKDALGGQKAASITFASDVKDGSSMRLAEDSTISNSTLAVSENQQNFWSDIGSLVEDNGRIEIEAKSLADSEAGKLLADQLESASGREVVAVETSENGSETGDTVQYDDKSAIVLEGNYYESEFSGSKIFVDGEQAFKVDLKGNGSIDFSYDADNDTLTIIDTDNTDGDSVLNITDLSGNDLKVNSVRIDTDLGELKSNVDLGALNVSRNGSIGTITLAQDSGAIDSITFEGHVNSPTDINAHVSFLQIERNLSSEANLNIDGNLKVLAVKGDCAGGVSVDGDVDNISLNRFSETGRLEIGGDVTSVEVVSGIEGQMKVDGNVASLSASWLASDAQVSISGDLDSLRVERTISGNLTVGGSVKSIAGSDLLDDSKIVVKGDLESFNLSGKIDGSLLIGGNAESIAADRAGSKTVILVTGELSSIAFSGYFSGDLNVSGDLGTFKAGVTYDQTSIKIGGDVNVIEVNDDSLDSDELRGQLNVDGNLKTLKVGDDIKANIAVKGNVGELIAGDEIKYNEISIGGDLDTLQANRVDGKISVTGNVGDIRIDNPAGKGDEFTGTLTVGGNLDSLYAGDDVKGVINVSGDVGRIEAGDDIAGAIRIDGNLGSISAEYDFKYDGDITVGGNVGSISAKDQVTKDISIKGYLDSFNVAGNFKGVLTAGQVNGQFDLVDGATEHHLNFKADTEIKYDGATDTLTYDSMGNVEAEPDWQVDAGDDQTVEELSEVTLGAAIEYADEAVTYTFDDGDLSDWNTTYGDWEIVDGRLHDTHGGENRIWLSEPTSENFTAELNARIDQGNGFGVWLAETTDPVTGYAVQFDPGYGLNGMLLFRHWENNRESVIKAVDYEGQWHNADHNFVIHVEDNVFTLTIDGKEYFKVEHNEFSHNNIGLRTWSGTELYVDDFTVTPIQDVSPDQFKYNWTQTSGPKVELSDPNAANSTFTALEGLTNTELTFELTVTDGENTSADTVNVLVNADNDAPTADAGINQKVNEGDLVKLDATGSSDPEGQELKYEWVQVSGSKVELSDPNATSTTFTAPEGLTNTNISFELRVSDGENTSVDTVNVTVNADNDAPTVDAGNDQIVNEGDTVTLAATADDPEGRNLTYTWTQTGGSPVSLTGADTATPSFTAPDISIDEALTFQVSVSDGSNTTVDTVTINIIAGPDNPTEPVTTDTNTLPPGHSSGGAESESFEFGKIASSVSGDESMPEDGSYYSSQNRYAIGLVNDVLQDSNQISGSMGLHTSLNIRGDSAIQLNQDGGWGDGGELGADERSDARSVLQAANIIRQSETGRTALGEMVDQAAQKPFEEWKGISHWDAGSEFSMPKLMEPLKVSEIARNLGINTAAEQLNLRDTSLFEMIKDTSEQLNKLNDTSTNIEATGQAKLFEVIRDTAEAMEKGDSSSEQIDDLIGKSLGEANILKLLDEAAHELGEARRESGVDNAQLCKSRLMEIINEITDEA